MQSLRQKEYGKYLKSKDWKTRSVVLRNAWGNKCAVCNNFSKNTLHLHHLNYDSLGKETARDVVLLCKSCHIAVHKGRLRIWIFTEEEYNYFQKIKHVLFDGLADTVTFVINKL